MDAEVLLCDNAEALNGKLYILGGGWSLVNLVAPLRCSLAIRISTAWSEANSPHRLKVLLVTQDGNPVLGSDGKPVINEGTFEVGRPVGLVQGEDLVNAVVLNYEGLDLPAGGYEFRVEIDSVLIRTVLFRAIKGVPQP
ncbi:MAG: DUF6941 family protein [Candidatus Dormibacteria bacterium]